MKLGKTPLSCNQKKKKQKWLLSDITDAHDNKGLKRTELFACVFGHSSPAKYHTLVILTP